MSTAVLTNVVTKRWDPAAIADTALKASARFWFAVTVIGQLAFAFAVASFYGLKILVFHISGGVLAMLSDADPMLFRGLAQLQLWPALLRKRLPRLPCTMSSRWTKTSRAAHRRPVWLQLKPEAS
jgi:hypothetical protein